MEYLWSPHPRESYTVTVNGEPAGLGARYEFEDRPGLWNMFWLHSIKVDLLLDWYLEPEDAPFDTAALGICIASADYDCHGLSFEFLCANMTAPQLIDRMLEKGYQPPIRKFWDETSSGWAGFVKDRLRNFKSLKKPKGILIKGKFPLH